MAAALADDHASPGKENRIAVTVRADRHWRSYAGNGQAAARAGRIGCLIE